MTKSSLSCIFSILSHLLTPPQPHFLVRLSAILHTFKDDFYAKSMIIKENNPDAMTDLKCDVIASELL